MARLPNFVVFMRVRLFHTLSLMLLCLVGVAVLAVAMVLAWKLRHGFSRLPGRPGC
jgi:hypothetical protein